MNVSSNKKKKAGANLGKCMHLSNLLLQKFVDCNRDVDGRIDADLMGTHSTDV